MKAPADDAIEKWRDAWAPPTRQTPPSQYHCQPATHRQVSVYTNKNCESEEYFHAQAGDSIRLDEDIYRFHARYYEVFSSQQPGSSPPRDPFIKLGSNLGANFFELAQMKTDGNRSLRFPCDWVHGAGSTRFNFSYLCLSVLICGPIVLGACSHDPSLPHPARTPPLPTFPVPFAATSRIIQT